MKIVSVINMLSWVALLCGAVGRISYPQEAAWVFLA